MAQSRFKKTRLYVRVSEIAKNMVWSTEFSLAWPGKYYNKKTYICLKESFFTMPVPLEVTQFPLVRLWARSAGGPSDSANLGGVGGGEWEWAAHAHSFFYHASFPLPAFIYFYICPFHLSTHFVGFVPRILNSYFILQYVYLNGQYHQIRSVCKCYS